jgi:hypothetical protein
MKPSRVIVCIVAATGAALAVDLYRPTATSLYDFDGHAVGRLETVMWRNYYEQRKLALLANLAGSQHTQFGQSWSRAWLTAFHAARAAFVFQQGKSRADYEKAIPALRSYYEEVLPAGSNIDRVAALELEWWILHRERAGEPLEQALADLQAAIYHVPAVRLAEHARLRAEAMRLCDAGGDWDKIRDLLDRSWTSLSVEINRSARK